MRVDEVPQRSDPAGSPSHTTNGCREEEGGHAGGPLRPRRGRRKGNHSEDAPAFGAKIAACPTTPFPCANAAREGSVSGARNVHLGAILERNSMECVGCDAGGTYHDWCHYLHPLSQRACEPIGCDSCQVARNARCFRNPSKGRIRPFLPSQVISIDEGTSTHGPGFDQCGDGAPKGC